MDIAQIITSIVSTGPLAAVLCLMWWMERKDKLAERKSKDAISIKFQTYLQENADRLIAFSEEQRKSMADHDKRIDETLSRLDRNRP